ncbi:hypothetical protein GALMADRAFT_1034324 [Galerina marginata CBS 339.88]|uniref:Uncharacterized protein n=1 Tax=Galerina marginata (strain CBS 339.88) TaxID=685588 RepID=A0A067SEW0_GALM3|nr:hypothetical protein GALMADRAFT_1034324 [Galerina marginata CBS 339.88]
MPIIATPNLRPTGGLVRNRPTITPDRSLLRTRRRTEDSDPQKAVALPSSGGRRGPSVYPRTSSNLQATAEEYRSRTYRTDRRTLPKELFLFIFAFLVAFKTYGGFQKKK